MNFISYSQFYKDIAKWENQLPNFDAICGVPRSGLIPAAHIALRRNIRLVDLSSLLQNPDEAIASAYMRQSNPIVKYKKPFGKKLLIVDDSTSDESVTFNELREKLKNTSLDITYGVVYRTSEKSKTDLYLCDVAQPRLFEWNIWRNRKLEKTLCDMDGVLCEDWKGTPESDKDDLFANHVLNAKPLYIPEWPIIAVVTSRLERYRKATEAWLQKHEVKYTKLIMHPAETPEVRRKLNDHAERKALAYKQNADSLLFIESDKNQAKKIHALTKKPVLCTDTMSLATIN